MYGAIKRRNKMRGFPDILGFLPETKGCAFTIECKVGKNKLSKDQIEMRSKLNKAGVLTITAYSLDDVIKYLSDKPLILK